jgi:hypothetical protein
MADRFSRIIPIAGQFMCLPFSSRFFVTKKTGFSNPQPLCLLQIRPSCSGVFIFLVLINFAIQGPQIGP